MFSHCHSCTEEVDLYLGVAEREDLPYLTVAVALDIAQLEDGPLHFGEGLEAALDSLTEVEALIGLLCGLHHRLPLVHLHHLVVAKGHHQTAVGSAEQYYGTYKDVEAAAEQAARDGSMPRLFMSVGEQDALVKNAFNRFTEKMTALNAPLTVWKAEGGHDHVFWKNSLTPLCEFLTERKAGF